jgi:hypothetical protein
MAELWSWVVPNQVQAGELATLATNHLICDLLRGDQSWEHPGR